MNLDKITLPDPANLTDSQKTERLWQGGAALATGISMLAILHDQIRSMRRQRKSLKGDPATGKAVVLRLPEMKVANAFDSLLTTAAVGGLTYVGWQKLYQELRRRQLEKEVEQADRAHTQVLQESVKKASGPGFSLWDYLKSTPQGIMHLAALAAAGGTYGLLESTFPRAKEKEQPGKPRKIVIKGFGTVHADGPGDGALGELDKLKAKDKAKKMQEAPVLLGGAPEQLTQSESAEENWQKAAMEMPVGLADERYAAAMLTAILAEQPQLKLAKSPLLGLIGSHAYNLNATETLLKEAGAEAAIAASEHGYDVFDSMSYAEKQAAINQAFSSRALSPTLTALALAELQEVSPDLAKRARVVADDPGYSALLTKFASLFYQVEALQLCEQQTEKSAALQQLHNGLQEQMGSLGLSGSVDAGGEVEEQDSAFKKTEDPINAFMAGKMS